MALDDNTIRKHPERGGRLFSPVRTDNVIREGSLVGQRKGSNLFEIPDPDNPRSDLIIRGVSRFECGPGVADGVKKIGVDSGLWGDFKSAGGEDQITNLHLDFIVYALDDDTLSLTSQGGILSPAGRVRFVDDDGYVTIEIEDQPVDMLLASATYIMKKTVIIDHTEDNFANKGAGVKTITKALSGGELPEYARYMGVVIGEESQTGFTDGSTGTYVLKIGQPFDDDCITTTVNVASGQSGFPKTGTLGVRAIMMMPLDNDDINVTLTSSVDLNTCTAGSISVTVYYTIAV